MCSEFYVLKYKLFLNKKNVFLLFIGTMKLLLALFILLAPHLSWALCDGCYSLSTAFNTKYVKPTEKNVYLVGKLFDPDNCVLNWFRGADIPLATITKYAIDWHTPDVRFDANLDGHFWIKSLIRPTDEGIWKGMLTCKNFTEGRVFLTRILFADQIKMMGAQLLEHFITPPDVIYKSNYTITHDGHNPECMNGPLPSCRYLSESEQLEFDIFTMEETGIWLLNYTLQNGKVYTKVYALGVVAPQECFGTHGYAPGERLNPRWQRKGHENLFWFKQEHGKSPDMKPVCNIKGGYKKEVFGDGYKCNFDGTLVVPKEECGLYWSFSYSTSIHFTPAHIRSFSVKCPGVDPPPFMCLPTGSYGAVGKRMVPYTGFNIRGNISLWLHKDIKNDFKQMCYAKNGYSVWQDRGMKKCYYDGSMVPSAEYCGNVYSVDIPVSLENATATLLHHVVACPSANIDRKKRSLLYTMVAKYTPPNMTFPPLPEIDEGLSIPMLESDNDFNYTFTIAHTLPNQYIVISTFNSSTVAVLAAFLLILFFLGVWLVCMYKRNKLEPNPEYAPPEYELKSPMYTHKKCTQL